MSQRQLSSARAASPATAAILLPLVVKDDGSALDVGRRMAERLCLGAPANGLASTVATLKNEGPDQLKLQLGSPAQSRARTVVAIGKTGAVARRTRVRTTREGRKPLNDYAHRDRWSSAWFHMIET